MTTVPFYPSPWTPIPLQGLHRSPKQPITRTLNRSRGVIISIGLQGAIEICSRMTSPGQPLSSGAHTLPIKIRGGRQLKIQEIPLGSVMSLSRNLHPPAMIDLEARLPHPPHHNRLKRSSCKMSQRTRRRKRGNSPMHDHLRATHQPPT